MGEEESGRGCGRGLLFLLLLAAAAGGFYLRDRLGERPISVGAPPPEVGVQPLAPRPHPAGRIASNISQPPFTEPAFDASACDDILGGGAVVGPDCITAQIHCDETVIGHTLGGVDRYNTRYWEQKFCWPATVDHDGGDERVYQLVMPEGDWRAWVDLHTRAHPAWSDRWSETHLIRRFCYGAASLCSAMDFRMQIDFTVRSGDAQLPSDDALRQAAELPEVSRPWDLQGAWQLRSEEVEIDWEDTLVPLVQALCLESLVPLLQTGHAVASRLTEYGYLRMDVEGTWIRLGGDGLASGRVPARPFIEGQLGCAGRLVSLLVALGLDGFDVRALKEDRRAASQAYGRWTENTDGAILGPIPDAPPRRDADGAVRLERGEALELYCGSERFVFPDDADVWLARLLDEALPSLGPDAHLVLPFRTRYGYLRIDGEGDRVRLSGDGLCDLRIPLDGLIGTLQNVALA